uniref:Uncharacterized protein n=1 Tax=Ciona savignyi TaxID=51511 RepID=H2YY32_CIOSA
LALAMILEIIRNVSTFTLLSTTLVIFAAVLYQYWWRRPNGFPPGPRGIPILGIIPFLDKFPEKLLKKWSLEKYGAVMSARLGTSDVVVLNTSESVVEAFTNQGNLTSGRPNENIFRQATGDKGIVFKDYSMKFKALKKWVIQSLSKHGFGRNGMEERITEEAVCFTEYLKCKVGKPVDIKLNLYVLTSNVICRIICGRRYELDDQRQLKFLETMQKMLGDPVDAPKVLLINFFPGLKNLPVFGPAHSRFVKRIEEVHDFARDHIEKHKKTFEENNLRDFVDNFIHEMKFGKETMKDYFTEDELKSIIRDMIVAGSETTSNSLLWCFVILLHHPKHKETIVKEIDEAMGKTLLPRTTTTSTMPFTCAFIQESMRYCTVVPMGSQHYCQEDIKINDYTIPKGTTIISNLWGVHNDPVTWPNPLHFDPHRHIDDQGKYRNSRNVIPFSIGPRSCLGEALARQEMFIFLIAILQKYEINPVPGKPLPSFVGINSLTYTPANFKLILTER